MVSISFMIHYLRLYLLLTLASVILLRHQNALVNIKWAPIHVYESSEVSVQGRVKNCIIQYYLSSDDDVDQSDTLLHCYIYPPLYHLLPTFLHAAVGREWLTTETKESINAAMKH